MAGGGGDYCLGHISTCVSVDNNFYKNKVQDEIETRIHAEFLVTHLVHKQLTV